MSDDKEVVITVRAKNLTKEEFDAARKGIAGLKGETEETDKKTRGFSASLRAFGKEHQESFKAVGQAVALVGGAIVTMGGAIIALGARGSTVADVRGHFDQLTRAAGSSADVMLGTLKKATANTITDFELMKSTNAGLSMGLKVTAGDLDLAGRAARMLADRLGGDTRQAYETVIQAMATGKDQTLKSIGVNIDAENAVLRHAKALGRQAETLSESERRAAIKTATLAALKKVVDDTGAAEEDFADRLDQAKVGLQNVLDRIGEAIAQSPALNAGLKTAGDAMMKAFGQPNQQHLNTVIKLVNDAAVFILDMADTAILAADYITRGWSGLKLLFAGTIGQITSTNLAFLRFVATSAEVASLMPGVGAQFQVVGNQARDLAVFVEGVNASFQDQMKEAWEGVKGNHALNQTLAAVRGSLANVRSAMLTASAAHVQTTSTTKTLTTATADLSEENLKAAKAAEEAAKKRLKIFADETEEYTNRLVKRHLREIEIVGDGLRRQREAETQNQALITAAQAAALEERQRRSMTSIDFEIAQIKRAAQEKRAQIMPFQQGWSEALVAIDAEMEEKITSARQKHNEEVSKMKAEMDSWGNLAKGWIQSIPDLLTQAFTGGGGVSGALKGLLSGVGGDIGEKLFGGANGLAQKAINSFGLNNLTGMFADLAGPLGSAVGALLGPLAEKVGGFFKNIFGIGKGEGRKMIEDFAQQFGGFRKLQDELLKLGGDSYKRLWDQLNTVGKNNTDQARAAIEAVTKAFSDAEEKTQRAEAAIQKYGFTFDELGPKIQNSRIKEVGKELFKDWEALVDAGIDVDAIVMRMGSSVNEFVHKARKMGTEIPAEMRPMLQRMVEMGQLTDENGNKLESLEGLTFAGTLTEGFNRIVGKFDELLARLDRGAGSVGKLFEGIPRTIDVEIRGRRTGEWVPEFDEGDGQSGPSAQDQFARGTPDLDFAPFGRRRTVDVHGDEAIVPRGGGHQLAAEIAAAMPTAGGGDVLINAPLVIGGEVVGWLNQRITRVAREAMAQGLIPVPSSVVQRQVSVG